MSDLSKLKDKIAVIGVGNTKYGNFPEIDDYGLAAHAFAMRSRTAASTRTRSMACWSAASRTTRGWRGARLNPRWTMTLPGHGRMSGMGIIEAAAAIDAGLCDYAALMYANIGRSRRVNYGGDESPGPGIRGASRPLARRTP